MEKSGYARYHPVLAEKQTVNFSLPDVAGGDA